MSAPLVFLDTETDGVHPGRKVWEIAMIRRDEKGQRETSFFVDIDLSTADQVGLKVGRFYDRHPMGRYLGGIDEDQIDPWGTHAWPPELAAREVARWTHGAHIVGAVPNFDTEALGNLLRDNGFTPAWHYHLIDVENLAVGWLNGRVEAWRSAPTRTNYNPLLEDLEKAALPWKSDALSRACGVEPPTEEERHTATGDARWAMRLYDRIVGGVA